MSKKRGLTRGAHRRIQNLAWTYLQRGGAIVPHNSESENPQADHDRVINKIVDDYFGGTTAKAAFERACGGLAPHLAETLHDTAWALVTAYIDAAFVFGTAVGLQIHAPQPRPAPSTTSTGDPRTRLLPFSGRRTRDDTPPPDDPHDRADGRRVCRQSALH